jgi:hypothetical protein
LAESQADCGGGRRQLRGPVRRRRHRHLLRRQLLRPPDDGPGPVVQLLGQRRRSRPAAEDGTGAGRAQLPPESRVQAAGPRAAGYPGVGRLRAQQGVHVPHPRARRDAAAAGDGGPPHRAAQHAKPDGRAHQVVHQQRVHGAAGDAVPGFPEAGAQVYAHRGAAGGDVQPGLRRAPAAGEPEHDGGGQRVRAGAQHHRGRGAPERQRAGSQRERGAPVAPPRARLLGARVRRGGLPRGRRRRGAAQPPGPAAAEHGGDLPVRMDGAPVRGGQPRRVGVPLPHRAAPAHGHGRRLRRGRRPRRQGAQGGRVVRRHGQRAHERRPPVIAVCDQGVRRQDSKDASRSLVWTRVCRSVSVR